MKILSANLWGLPWPLLRGKQKRLKKFIEFAKKEAPEIICLQEVWLKKDLKLLKTEFEKYGYDSFSQGGFLMNKSGLVTFSKFPIKKTDIIILNKERNFFRGTKDKFLQRESFWPRKILVIYIEREGKKFAVLNVHMTYFSDKSKREVAAKVKEGEIKQLFDYIEKIKNSTNDIFIGGDFNIDIKNMPPIDKSLKIISDTSTYSLDTDYLKTTCDFIYGPSFAKILNNEIIKSPVVSDHFMVMSEVEI
jgi:exonuclease III